MEVMLEACLAGRLGTLFNDGKGAVALGGFCYLLGEPSERLMAFVAEHCAGRLCVPKSDGWLRRIKDACPDLKPMTRWLMREPDGGFDLERLRSAGEGLPPEYAVKRVDQALYAQSPIPLGRGYPSPEAYLRRGLGALALYRGAVVAASCAFLEYEGAVEVDIVTLEQHRRKGLALACAARLIELCVEQGLSPHWDAQNAASVKLAEKLGYRVDREYTGYYRQ